jgi:hypothetical protein
LVALLEEGHNIIERWEPGKDGKIVENEATAIAALPPAELRRKGKGSIGVAI